MIAEHDIRKVPFIVCRDYWDPVTGWFFPKGLWATVHDSFEENYTNQWNTPAIRQMGVADIHGKMVNIPRFNLTRVYKQEEN